MLVSFICNMTSATSRARTDNLIKVVENQKNISTVFLVNFVRQAHFWLVGMVTKTKIFFMDGLQKKKT